METNMTEHEVRTAYVNEVRRADPKDNALFTSLFNRGVKLFQISDEAIADRFDVSRPTLARWMNGKNLPHPAMRRAIFEWLIQQTQPMLK